ncbi:MAG: transposase [Candidatus Marinimicrobia bacterium]|nr:transposase [Candidatus Neomarinimicrobiota bacterium]
MTTVGEGIKTEVSPGIKRRYISREYKMKILQEYDSCTRVGEKGELLRREGLYSSSVTAWRRQLLKGNLDNQRLLAIEVENQRLRRELDIAQKVIDVQKKILDISELGLNRK